MGGGDGGVFVNRSVTLSILGVEPVMLAETDADVSIISILGLSYW